MTLIEALRGLEEQHKHWVAHPDTTSRGQLTDSRHILALIQVARAADRVLYYVDKSDEVEEFLEEALADLSRCLGAEG